MERYEAYKDSGIEWIGAIPVDWGLAPVKGVSKIVAGKTPRSDNEKYWGGDIPWITPADMSEKYTSSGARSITEIGLNDAGLDLVPENSIIVSNRAPIGLISIASNPLSTNQGCKALVLEKGVPDYLYYCLACSSQELERLGKGTTFLELSAQDLGSHKIPWPSARIQTAISEYLDQKTAEIDSLIEQTERSIKLLEEYRKSVISEAVTKGLDPNVPMKDSGIDWIGDIPRTWSTQPLKYITLSIESGRSVDGSNYPASENEHGVLTLSSVYKASFNPQANKAVEDAESISLLRCPVKGGSLLISRCNTSEWVGTAAIVENDIPNLFLPDKIWQLGFSSWALCRWIWYSLQSNYARHYFAVNSVGASSTMQNISKDDLLALVIPVPPANEQNAILAHLDKEVDAINQSVTARKSFIAKLQEYRKSLISEAVTGKFVVPGVE